MRRGLTSRMAEALNVKQNRPKEATGARPASGPNSGKATGAIYLRLSPADVDFFPGNPRIENQNYAQLRESILNRGLEIAPTIAEDPKTKRYTIYKGGNTRLKVLRELVNEGHREFEQVDFRLVEWVSLVDAQVAHLIENGVRDDLTFIERARLVLDAKSELDKEKGKITDDAFIGQMAGLGYPSLSKKLLALMRWVTGRGGELFPKQLESGLGIKKCENLRSAVSALEEQAKVSGKGRAEIRETIQAVASETDASKDQFSLPAFQKAAAAKLQIQGKPPEKKQQKPAKGRAPDNVSGPIPVSKAVLSIPECRKRAGELALNLAQKHHLAGCLRQVDTGLGYVMLDVPVFEMEDSSMEKKKCAWVFWELLNYSDLLSAPRKLLPDTILKNCRAELRGLFHQNYEPAFALLGIPDVGAGAYRAVRLLDANSHARYLELQQLYRRLHQLAVEQKTSLWGRND